MTRPPSGASPTCVGMVRAQVLWTVVVVNLKRAARLVAERATMPTRAAPSLREAA